ncbi:MAG: hypothetical protein WDA65_01720 [Christensenellales bacterium]
MSDFDSMMTIITIAIGAFALFSAITGKGPAFNNNYPKEMKEDADKMLRIACWIAGPILLASGILEYIGVGWAFYISMFTILPGCVVFTVLFRRKFKKYL